MLCAEPLRPLAHSQKTCEATERDSQNRYGDHQGSETELRNAHGPISDGFRSILPQRARFAKILESARKGRSRRYSQAGLFNRMRYECRGDLCYGSRSSFSIFGPSLRFHIIVCFHIWFCYL